MTMSMRICLSIIALLALLSSTQAASIAREQQQQLKLQANTFEARQQQPDVSGEDSDEHDNEDAEAEQLQQQILAQQQQAIAAAADDSDEDGGDDTNEEDDDDDDGERRRRRRREAETEAVTEIPKEEASASIEHAEEALGGIKDGGNKSPVTGTVTPTPAAATSNTSVLILIRDALKKVTTVLPTEQVNSALQYFQLFEHFLQQAIEQVIDDDDDDDEEELAPVEPATEDDKKPVAETASTAQESGVDSVDGAVMPSVVTEGLPVSPSKDIVTSTVKTDAALASETTQASVVNVAVEGATAASLIDPPMMMPAEATNNI